MKMGSKAERTGKCKCGGKDYDIFEVRITREFEVITTPWCHKCDGMWDTKSREYRQYVTRPQEIEKIRLADIDRKKFLLKEVSFIDGKISQLQKEKIKIQREIELL